MQPSDGNYLVTVTKSKMADKSATLPSKRKTDDSIAFYKATKAATLGHDNKGIKDANNGYIATVLSAKQCLKAMCGGTLMTKISIRNGKHNSKKRFVRLDEDLLGIRYTPSRKKDGFRVHLKDLKMILTDDRLPEDGGFTSHPRERCMVIVYTNKENEAEQLHLVTSSNEVVMKWRFGLNNLIRRKGYLLSRPDPLRDEWLKEAFEQHDVDKNGALSLDEVDKLLHSLNIFIDRTTLKKFFEQANVDGPQGHEEGMLTKEEFSMFFRNISTRKDIVDVLEKYSTSKQNLSVSELTEFLKANEGGNHANETKCYEVIEKFEPVGKLRQKFLLGLDGFRNFMLGPDGDVFNPNHKEIYQDMNQPLSHYFISSSHNTYLQQDQIRGPSSVDAYISALKRGCRCVELDCWDGDKMDPVIYHGHTLTSKILFKNVIQAIKEHAFTASQYPVILSFENHCSVDQQVVMATYIRDILGDMLCTDKLSDDLNQLPSPEYLKGKILIKGKKIPKAMESANCELSEEEEDGNDGNGIESAKEETLPKKKSGKKLRLAPELSDLVNYVQSVSFGSFKRSLDNQHCYQMSSLGENKFCNLGEKQPERFIKYNQKFLTRTYPAGKRVDSSNYNPTKGWIVGCQIVALNFQTNGPMMDLYQGKFIDNGGCGYVLKPKCLLQETFNPRNRRQLDRKPMKIDLKIYSGQQLPKPKASKDKSVIDPYVRVDVYGIPADTKPKAFATTAIPNNGFNPVWDEGCTLTVQVPELALLRFSVYDNDVGSDDFVAQFTLPVSSLKSGYRHIFLKDYSGESLPHASLFIHVLIS